MAIIHLEIQRWITDGSCGDSAMSNPFSLLNTEQVKYSNAYLSNAHTKASQ